MCRMSQSVVEISFLHLADGVPNMAVWLADKPTSMLAIFDAEIICLIRTLSPAAWSGLPKVHAAITDLPIINSLGDLQPHMGALVRVRGTVIHCSDGFQQLKEVAFLCEKCKTYVGPLLHKGPSEMGLSFCPDVSQVLNSISDC